MTRAVRILLRLACLGALSFFPMHSQAGANYWFDLLTEDAATAIVFYSDLFGWETRLFHKGYYLIMQDGQSIGGIAQIEGELAEGNESLWLLAIPAMDLDDSIDLARANGGTLHIAPEETSMIQRFAMILDPQGAPIILLGSYSAGLTTPSVNRWVWAELWTGQPEEAAAFYDKLSDIDIDWVRDEETPVGFMSVAGRDWASITTPPFEGTPELWMPYVLVEDISKTVDRVKELGGSVLAQVSDNLREGSLALVADPTGAAFIVYEDRAAETATSGHRGLGAEFRWGEKYRANGPVSIGPPSPTQRP